ncbi:MAG: hypothetical protein LBB98_02125 [Treponema sp.]|jgi:hypothetical protein|nr:hypothetical protein [Treponema sp.]
MKRYHIKSEPGQIEYLDIINENKDGYIIRVTRIKDGYEKVIEELLSRRLFNICLKTGFIYQAEKNVVPAA